MVANEGWLAKFSEAQVHHISMAVSDHCLFGFVLEEKGSTKESEEEILF